jgi:hypothetical protein
MGKRELVLIAAFVVLGAVVYQLTAPPPPPGSESISFGSIFRNMRRNMQGPREAASADSNATTPVPATVKELRLNLTSWVSDVTVIGEARDDIAVTFHATARGFDQAEAKAAVASVKPQLEPAADAIVVSLNGMPWRRSGRAATQVTAALTLKVPSRLTIRVEPHVGHLAIGGLAGAMIIGSRGETKISKIDGPVQLVHSGGELDIDGAAKLKLNARGSRGKVRRISGGLTLDCIGGELDFSDITGPMEVESRNTDLRFDDLMSLKGPLRINATNGSVRVNGLKVETRIDGRNTEVNVTMDAPAPVTIYNASDDVIVTPPPGGYTLDAVATDGQITIDDGDLKPAASDSDQRASGAVRGGGPALTLRNSHGAIRLNKHGGK